IGLSIIVPGVLIASGRSACLKVLAPAILVLILVWICTTYPTGMFESLHFLAVSGLLLFSLGLTLKYLKDRHEIDQEALAAAAAAYLLFGLACGAIYAALAVLYPGGLEFAGMTHEPNLHDHVYFSFVVLTTIGFGDVVPKDALNRSMAMLEGIAGLFYIAVDISRLVSLYHQRRAGY
ncbi:MAG: potassium channel family protein, partial [Verrucomicrobia bacterium]|nr:potassium channel family protein [Verrucomicrobiota bacterium]